MEIKTFRVFSYCDDFDERSQEMLAEYGSSDIYISWTAYSDGSEGWLANKLIELGAEENETVLIHLDW